MNAPAATAPPPDARFGPLLSQVDAAPHTARRITVRAPGGYGKTGLLRELERTYRRAGVRVLDGWYEVPEPTDEPTVVLADDAHLLAGDRLRELTRLVTGDGTVGLVLAHRPWPRPPALADLVRACPPPLTLRPLSERQTAERLGADADPALVGHVHALTGGVPRFVERLAAAPVRPDGEVPPQVLEQFRAELEELDRQPLEYLLAAATGVDLTHDLLVELFDRTPAGVDELVEAVRATGLLGVDGRPVPVAGRAVTALTPVSRRVAVWGRLSELLRAGGAALLPLARAVRGSGTPGAGLSELFHDAGVEALPDDPALAAELLALAGTGGRSDPVRHALAALLAGDPDRALRLVDPLIDAQRPGERTAAAEVAGAALAHRGQLARSAELYRWSGTASSTALAAVGFTAVGRPDRVTPPPDGPPTLAANAASLLADGVRESVSGSPTTALSTLVQAAGLLEPAGRAVPLPDSPAALATLVALHAGEPELGESVLDRAIEVELGGPLFRRRHLLLRAWSLMVRGRTGPATERAAAAQAGGSSPRDVLFAVGLRVGTARRDSDLARVRAGWAQAGDALPRHPVDLFTLLPLAELAVAAARLGEYQRIRPYLRQADQLLDRLDRPPLWAAPLHWSAVHVAILTEEPAVADEHVAALAAIAPHSRYASAVAAAARQWVAVLRGDIDPAAVEAAARGLQGAGLDWDAARLAGQAAIRTPDRRAMTRLLDCARILRGRPPARPAAGRATGAARGPAGAGPGLSDREREVATLILDGLTYREIGNRLFISAKTVEHHVARMRQRLGCTSRGDLLARLRRILVDRAGE